MFHTVTTKEGGEMLSNAEREQRRAVKTALVASEDKRQKFVRLARARMTRLLHAAGAIGQLSSSAYEFTPDQIERMKVAASDRLSAEFAKFDHVKGSQTHAFDF
jgi:hypothetical protein